MSERATTRQEGRKYNEKGYTSKNYLEPQSLFRTITALITDLRHRKLIKCARYEEHVWKEYTFEAYQAGGQGNYRTKLNARTRKQHMQSVHDMTKWHTKSVQPNYISCRRRSPICILLPPPSLVCHPNRLEFIGYTTTMLRRGADLW